MSLSSRGFHYFFFPSSLREPASKHLGLGLARSWTSSPLAPAFSTSPRLLLLRTAILHREGVVRFVRSRHHPPPTSIYRKGIGSATPPVARDASPFPRTSDLHLYDLSRILGRGFGRALAMEMEQQDSPPPQRNTSLTPLTSYSPLPERETTPTPQRSTDGIENSASTTRWRISVATNSFRCKNTFTFPSAAHRLVGPAFNPLMRMYCTLITLLSARVETFDQPRSRG